MSEPFLDKVLSITRERVRMQKPLYARMRSNAEQVRSGIENRQFHAALKRSDRRNIIAEIKRASPSKGVISADVDSVNVARSYEKAGAAAISVLTEPTFFHGSIDDLRSVRNAVHTPVLRKDFIVDEIQIFEAAASGSDAVLLIVAAVTYAELKGLRKTAEALGMDTLVEVHNEEELVIASDAGATIMGVNNRDLRSLQVSLETSRRLICHRPEGSLMVAESGLTNAAEIEELSELGYNAFLVGEALMRDADAGVKLRSFMGTGAAEL